MPTTSYKQAGLLVAAAVAVTALISSLGALSGQIQKKSAHPISLQQFMPNVIQVRPDFSMVDLNGTIRDIREWNGKVVAINFWATWCPPCRHEIPIFNTLQRKYGPHGMQFIGIAVDDRGAIRSYLTAHPIHYPILLGQDDAATLAMRYGDHEGVLPYTAIIDRRGRIVYTHYGELSAHLAEEAIKSLL